TPATAPPIAAQRHHPRPGSRCGEEEEDCFINALPIVRSLSNARRTPPAPLYSTKSFFVCWRE
ncbi:TPA: hypothetical protein ACT5B9_003642, partial [Burkholderia cenocepacia]